jgi:hypothetical protein
VIVCVVSGATMVVVSSNMAVVVVSWASWVDDTACWPVVVGPCVGAAVSSVVVSASVGRAVIAEVGAAVSSVVRSVVVNS